VGNGGKSFPNEKDGIAIARVVANELDTSKFDPLLVKSSARGIVKCLDGLVARVDNLVSSPSHVDSSEM
jgi:conserved oligomeric Golgi complex subunit 5